MVGYEAIPEQFRSGIPAIENEKFKYTQYSFNAIVDSTVKRAQAVIESAGGRVTDTEVTIPLQTPVAPPLEEWKADPPILRLSIDDPAWEWKGPWSRKSYEHPWGGWEAMLATEAGAEAVLTFEGTGVAVMGDMTQEGGRADVFLDGGKSDHILDAWIPERTNDIDYWHVTGLEPGEHALRIVVREDADDRSGGRDIRIRDVVVYGKKIPDL
jgi:hypothetical protein